MFPIIVCRYKKYEDYHTSCVSQWSALRSRWYTLASGHKARLLALVKAEVPDPNKLLQAITKMEGAEELVVEELAQVKAKFVELVEGAQSEMEAMANSERASYDDLMVVMRKYEDYPEQDIAAAREHLQRRVDEKGDAIEERMKQLAASADIVEVRAAIKEFAESSDRFAIRVAELRRAASALVAEISAVMKEARRAVHPQEIAAVLERAEAFEEVVVERRALLTRQRELTQAATKELQALTATNDFAVVQKGVMKYVDWIDFDEGTRRAYGQVHEHWEKLLDGVRAKLRELCSEDDPRAITATLKEMEGFNWKGYEAREGGESVSEIIDAARPSPFLY